MRIATVAVFLALALLWAPGLLACEKCGKPPSGETKKAGKFRDERGAHDVRRPGKSYEINVPDLECDNCVKVLREKLKQGVPEILEVEGDLDGKTLKVTVEDGVKLDENKAKKIIQGSGYTWGGVRDLNAGKKSDQSEPSQAKPEKAEKKAPEENEEKTEEKTENQPKQGEPQPHNDK